jgi:hypothetical protein
LTSPKLKFVPLLLKAWLCDPASRPDCRAYSLAGLRAYCQAMEADFFEPRRGGKQ